MRKFSRGIIAAVVVISGLAVPSVASAATLDQAFCEAATPGGLEGTWSGGNTCTVDLTNLSNQILTVPAGVTLTNSGGAGAINLDLTIEVGGSVVITGSASSIDPTSSVVNDGTFTIQASQFALGGTTFVNRGTLTGTRLLVLDDSSVDNFGSATLDQLLVDGNWVNHCRSVYTVAEPLDGAGSIDDLTCSIKVTITPAPASGDSPLAVTWTVTLANDGQEALTAPQVTLSADGGATSFATLAAPPASGDAGTVGVLDVGEMWTWTVNRSETADVTVTATGAGTLEGEVITYPDDPDARASAAVTVTTPTTAAPTTAAPTTAAPTTAAPTTAAPVTTTTIAVGATLPATGPNGSSSSIALVAGLLVLAGGSLLIIRRRA
jgi:LPXTG-motif cell wall-anchored protein